jgi:hypothetical protein
MMSVEKNYKDKVTTNDVSCPNCENDLETHSNEQLQSCALSEISKINRKLGVDND